MMFDLFRRIRMSFLLTAVLTILLGLILILAPGTAVRTIFLVVGWMLLLTGAGSLLTALCSRGKPMGQGDLVLGLIQVATGLVVLMRPWAMSTAFLWWSVSSRWSWAWWS
jgi:uncharacterized membrane protein HdeD (DUF308 family)